MKESNVCRFVPTYRDNSDLNILNFVYEKQADFREMKTASAFALHYVVRGKGVFHTERGDFPLCAGSLFLIVPIKRYRIEDVEDLEYIYITFVGKRAYFLVERTPFSLEDPVSYGYGEVAELWERAVLNSSVPGLDLAAEGVLLYTFSRVCASLEAASRSKEDSGWIMQIKNYVDHHFIESDLTLQSVSEKYSYDYRYVSDVFKKTVGVSFTRYLNQLRLDSARHLMDSGFRSVKEAALLSGYTDALYFSKLFRQCYGVSPREYLKGME